MKQQPLQKLNLKVRDTKMIKLPLLENVDLEPHWNEEIDNKLAMKQHLLFANVQKNPCAVVQKSTLPIALNHLSKLDIDYPIIVYDTSLEKFKQVLILKM